MPKTKNSADSSGVKTSAEPTYSYGVPFPSRNSAASSSSAKTKPEHPKESTDELQNDIITHAEPSLGDILRRTQGTPEEREGSPPRADSLAVLLEQGLKSEDVSLLQSVLFRSEDDLIRKTIQHLPVQFTLPLIRQLGKMSAEERQKPNRAPLQWLSAVLSIRSSYLTTVPDIADQLRDIYTFAERRTKYLDRFIRLSGVVNAAVNLGKQRHEQIADSQKPKKAVLSYNEPLDDAESDEEEEEEDDSDVESEHDTYSEEENGDISEESESEEPAKRKRKTNNQDSEDDDRPISLPQKKKSFRKQEKEIFPSDDDDEDDDDEA